VDKGLGVAASLRYKKDESIISVDGNARRSVVWQGKGVGPQDGDSVVGVFHSGGYTDLLISHNKEVVSTLLLTCGGANPLF
jgi:hypothetical protein